MAERDPRSIELKELEAKAIVAKDTADKRWKANRLLRWANVVSEYMDTKKGTAVSIGAIAALAAISFAAQNPALEPIIDGYGKPFADATPAIAGSFGGIMAGKGLKLATLFTEKRIRSHALRNIEKNGIDSPRQLRLTLATHDELPSGSEVNKWTAGDVRGERKDDARFPLVHAMTQVLYRKEKKRVQKVREAKQNARYKEAKQNASYMARKLFWEGTALAQETRAKMWYILARSGITTADLLLGALGGFALSMVLEANFPKSIAALGGLADDLVAMGLVASRSAFARFSEAVAVPEESKEEAELESSTKISS